MCRYFRVVGEPFHDSEGVRYCLKIRWNMDAFINKYGENGFIVQKVSFSN